jgi:hemerythrin-like domain-containing protein/nucleotide-binding universal stress UspA family protein
VNDKMYRHLLVPIDATDASVELVTSALDFAAAARARVTFLYAALHDVEAVSNPACKTRDYPYQATAAGVEVLARAEAAARAWGVPCESMHAAGDEFSVAIIAAARDRGCDLILLPSQARCSGCEASPSYETMDVLSQSSLPVLVAATGKLPPPGAAIAVLRDEHRSLATVLHAWNGALAAAEPAGMTLPASLMRSMLEFIERLGARHHPKEQLLFSRLRARTSLVNPDIEELERQHQREEVFLAELAQKVSALEYLSDHVEQTDASRSLKRSVGEYVRFMWDHVGREEAVILTAARRHLDESDWLQLDHDFAAMPADDAETLQDVERLHLCSNFMGGAAWPSITPTPCHGG